MSTLRKVHTGLGLALVTALAFVAGSALASDMESSSVNPTEPGEPPIGLRCTVSSGTSPTGREWARLVILKETHGEVLCSRVRLGTPAPTDFPSCYGRKEELGCTIIVD